MRKFFTTKPLPEASTEELKRPELLLKAVTYVTAAFIIANIGYAVFLLVSHKIDRVSDLLGRNRFSMGGFGASLLFETYAMRKIKAQIKTRELSGTDQ